MKSAGGCECGSSFSKGTSNPEENSILVRSGRLDVVPPAPDRLSEEGTGTSGLLKY